MIRKVFITRKIPDQGIKILIEKGYNVFVNPFDYVLDKKQLIQMAKGADAILSLLTDKIDAEFLDAIGPQLKIVANYAVGFDNIDLKAAKERNVLIANTPGPEVILSVAEHTFTLMLALARRITESDSFAKSGKYKGWEPMLLLGVDVYGKTLGIVGLGRIGEGVAQRAVKGFGMKVLYYDVNRNANFEKEYNAHYVSFEELLKTSDFVSLHVPLLPSTHHLMSTKQFNLMKKTAFLINTARGPVVDEKALLKALNNKKIAGVALDVFECEPSIDCNPTDHMELKVFPNVILTPHTASATIEARQAMSRIAAENIIAAFYGKEPPNIVRI